MKTSSNVRCFFFNKYYVNTSTSTLLLSCMLWIRKILPHVPFQNILFIKLLPSILHSSCFTVKFNKVLFQVICIYFFYKQNDFDSHLLQDVQKVYHLQFLTRINICYWSAHSCCFKKDDSYTVLEYK